jgi:hypothetical protein
MKRRNFLASLFALPFAVKPLEALTRKPGIGSATANELAALVEERFDFHRKAMLHNTESVRQMTQALMQFAPSGWKVEQSRYRDADVMHRALKRFKKLPEKE